LLIGAGVGDWPWVRFLLYAALQVLRWMLYLVMWLAIIHAVLGWINPHAPVAPVIGMLARPFLAPLQRVIPLIGGVDLSPLALVVLVNLVLLVVPRFGL
jgi:YggT family protein